MSKGKVCLVLLLLVGALVAVVVLAVFLTRPSCTPGLYLDAAVAADTQTCSNIGRDILKHGGSAVDAAIAALICSSVLNPQSSGLGGGVIFTIYNATTGDVEVINARERVPLVFTKNLLAGCEDSFPTGSQWIGIPGELRGYEEAHRRYGRLPWKSLFDPTIELLQHGIIIPPVLSMFLNHPILKKKTKESALCSQLFCKDGKFLMAGETFHWPALKKTLTEVSLKGAKEFYEGQTAKLLEADIRRAGGSLTSSDLRGFKAEVTQPLNISLGNYTIYSPPPPAGGFVLLLILNILKGFEFTAQSVETPSRKIETYHRIVEAMKFGNGQKPKLDDPDISGVEKAEIQKLLSDDFAEEARRRITEKGNHGAEYYNIVPSGKESHGTTHVSVIAKDGSAVSATSTINYPFGSMIYSNNTGIILNNELADFCRKKLKSFSSGERPPSAMVPSILLSKDKKSMLVIGGSGGELIISATALAIINKLWFGYDLKKAIDEHIFHVNTTSIQFEKGFDENVKKGLLEKGHSDQQNPLMLNVVQGVSREERCISAYSDKRKMGKAAGY
ncbi:glutathione hydrolase 5 proenzyme isoform X1 [Alligator mississippiensis]|uniref:glutathione hydrolase 5 proenzyme isoform X1 n=1 Tax=Alligator mississippiensis TaxID=8496 RepID=UPI002877E01E|nr:glutathione hydrolase 5 proenzyme isoform X1 [Alligator mississippiensis]